MLSDARLELASFIAAMSEEQLKAFLEAVKSDPGLQEKLKAAAGADAVATIAKTEGFVISAEEFVRSQADISEEDVEGLAGGGGAYCNTGKTTHC